MSLSWAAYAQTRVALVSTCGGEAGQNVLALADAALSAETNIALVERREVERILNEQKLTRCGLSEADQAVAAGKLLGVDVFAALETYPGSPDALGLVIFDASSGVRLWDKALPAGDIPGVTEAVAAATRTACAKRIRMRHDLHTVCVLSVRNADLPRAMDGFCESVRLLLERQLIGSPALAVLERRRLEQVNLEHSLPLASTTGDLFPSLVVMEIEVSRAPDGNGIAVVAFLSDSTGKTIRKAEARASDKNAAALTQLLANEITAALKVAGTEGLGDRAREAERFRQETKLLWSYDEHFRALEMAEAAYALQPTADFQAVLARSLIDSGLQILHPGGQRRRGQFHCLATDDEIRRSLALAQRAASYAAETQQTAVFTNRTETREMSENLNYTALYIKRYIEDILQVCQPDAYQLFGSEGWDTLCLPLQAYLLEGRSPRIDEAIESCHASWRNPETDQMLRSILELYRTSVFKFDALVAQRVKPAGPQMNSLDELLARFHAEAPRLSPEESSERVRKIRLSAQELIRDAKSKHLVELCLRIENRVGEALMMARSADALEGEYAAFLEFLLEQGDPPPTFFVAPAVNSPLHRRDLSAEEYRRWRGILDRVLELVNAPDCHLDSSQRDRIRAETEYGRYRLLRLHSPAELAGPPPWTAAQVVLDCRNQKPGLVRFYSPYVCNDNVYVMGLGKEDGSGANYFQLLRCSLVNGPVEYLSKIALADKPKKLAVRSQPGGSLFHYEPAESACLYEGRYFANPADGTGIWAFPIGGGTGTRITTREGLPSDDVEALACLDGKLYTGLGGGYLVAYDLKTNLCDVLASSRRKEKRSPFDDGPLFSVRYLVADPQRHRIVFLATSHFELNSSNQTIGIWEFTPSNRSFKRLLPMALDSNGPSWGSAVVNDRFLLQTHRGSLVFDLRNNTASVLTRGLRSFPPGADVYEQAEPRNKPNSLLSRRSRLFYPPLAVCGNWLWSASPWGRVSLDGQKQETFAPLRADHGIGDFFYPTECLQAVGDGRQILAGDQYTLWLLTFPSEASRMSP